MLCWNNQACWTTLSFHCRRFWLGLVAFLYHVHYFCNPSLYSDTSYTVSSETPVRIPIKIGFIKQPLVSHRTQRINHLKEILKLCSNTVWKEIYLMIWEASPSFLRHGMSYQMTCQGSSAPQRNHNSQYYTAMVFLPASEAVSVNEL